MKRLLVIILALFTMFTMTACGESTSTTMSGSYFLAESSNKGISQIDEVCNYTVTFEQKASQDISLELTSGSFTTTLKNTTYGESETPCYLYTTTLKLSGKYTIGGVETPFTDDTVSTKVYFLGVSDNLKPLYSERTCDYHTPKKENNTYAITEYAFSQTINYTDSEAVVSITGTTNVDSSTKTYKNYSKDATYYFDNELLTFSPRTFELDSSATFSFASIDGLAQTKQSMTLKYSQPTTETTSSSSTTTETYKKITFDNYVRNKTKITSVETVPVVISNTNSLFTSSITCYFAKTSTSNDQKYGERNRLIQMVTSTNYNFGSFKYLINKTTIS